MPLDPPSSITKASNSIDTQSVLGLLGVLLTFVTLQSAPWLARHMISSAPDLADKRGNRELYLVLGPATLTFFVSIWLLFPFAVQQLRKFRIYWRPVFTFSSLLACCAFFCAFTFRFGNHQFGGYDFSILIDTAWRLASGQVPYVDFVCTPPPGFYLGLKYAFLVFGVSWNAQLYATILFTCLSFVWIFALCQCLIGSRAAALLIAFTIESAAILTLDFWWYNNVTAIGAALFLLSCLAYLKFPDSIPTKLSYIISLSLLSLMKPNVAGLLIAGALPLLLIATSRKLELGLHTLAAALLTLFFLYLNHVSPIGMLHSYADAAVRRGKLSNFGFRYTALLYRLRVFACTIALCVPLLTLIPRIGRGIKQLHWATIASSLLYLLALLVSGVAMFTNGELKDVEWSILIGAGAVLTFQSKSWLLRRTYIALLCSLILSDLYQGAIRYRVYGIGPHTYFEWQQADISPGIPFFRDLEASPRFATIISEIKQATRDNPGPIFFGPRLEFSYAAFGLQSPLHIPVWWDPGASFRADQESSLLASWQADRLATLIFLKDDFTFYSTAFLQRIQDGYCRDDSFPELTVFHSGRSNCASDTFSHE